MDAELTVELRTVRIRDHSGVHHEVEEIARRGLWSVAPNLLFPGYYIIVYGGAILSLSEATQDYRWTLRAANAAMHEIAECLGDHFSFDQEVQPAQLRELDRIWWEAQSLTASHRDVFPDGTRRNP